MMPPNGEQAIEALLKFARSFDMDKNETSSMACKQCGVVDQRGPHTSQNCLAVILYHNGQLRQQVEKLQQQVSSLLEEKGNQVSLTDLLANIESITFSVEVNVVSSTQHFIEVLEAHPLFQELQKIAQDNPDAVLKRLSEVALLSFDHRYENPFDVAAASYYWSIKSLHLPLSIYEEKAARIINSMSNLWWPIQLMSYHPVQVQLIRAKDLVKQESWISWCIDQLIGWWKALWTATPTI